MVRQPVMALVDADLGIGAEIQLAPEHEGDDAREIAAERQPLQLEHQLHVLVEAPGNAGRPVETGERLIGPAPLRALDAPFDLAHGVEILADAGAIARPEILLQPRQVGHHRIEKTAVLACLRLTLRRGAAVAKQPLEDEPGIVLGGKRRRRRSPGQGIEVGAAVAVLALPGEEVEIDRELERGQRRGGAEGHGRNLVRRRAVAHVGPLGALAVHAGEPRARAACVIAVGAVVEGIGLVLGKAAHDHGPVAERSERRENRRQLERRPFAGRGPVVDAGEIARDAVGQVNEAEPRRRARRRLRQHRGRRHHGVEERQGQRRAQASQHRASRQRGLGDEHRPSPCFLPTWPGPRRRHRRPGACGTARWSRRPPPGPTCGSPPARPGAGCSVPPARRSTRARGPGHRSASSL